MFSPEKIHEKLKQLGVNNPPAPNTIAKYFPKTRKPPSQKQIQSWKTFLKNHQSRIWAMDFFTIPTLKFEVLYVFILIKHSTREIIHFGITPNPNSRWLKQCLRTATPYDFKPDYLIHDNDPVFLAKEIQDFLQASEIKSKKTSIQSPWQNPIAERAVGILRQELLNHIIPLNEEHLHQLLKEYIDDYYNTYRTHQGIDCKTPIPGEVYFPTDISNTRLKANPILNGLYHNYKKIS